MMRVADVSCVLNYGRLGLLRASGAKRRPGLVLRTGKGREVSVPVFVPEPKHFVS